MCRYDETEGRCIYSSGSPFPEYKSTSGKILKPGQANNSYIFPGIALGAIACGAMKINDDMFMIAAETLAGILFLVTSLIIFSTRSKNKMLQH